tara:strand:- start:559 stop:1296 length:738 start_codon:yes stop_codon:yes gene_type:complete
MPLKSVVLISGGADSLYCALRELRETDNEVHLHRHKYQFGYAEYQHSRMQSIASMASDRLDNYILPWLRDNERPFSYSVSSSDFSELPEGSMQIGNKSHLSYVGGYVCTALGAGRLITGHQMMTPSNGPRNHPRMMSLFLGSFDEGRSVLPKDVEWYFPCWNYDLDKGRGKKEICDYIGPLVDLTNSCLNPKKSDDGVWEQCGNRWPIQHYKDGVKTSAIRCWQCDESQDTLGRIPDIRTASDAQ